MDATNAESAEKLYLGLVEERDSLERNDTLTALIRHSFAIQSKLVHLQRDNDQTNEASGTSSQPQPISDERTFMDLQKKVTGLQKQLAE